MSPLKASEMSSTPAPSSRSVILSSINLFFSCLVALMEQFTFCSSLELYKVWDIVVVARCASLLWYCHICTQQQCDAMYSSESVFDLDGDSEHIRDNPPSWWNSKCHKAREVRKSSQPEPLRSPVDHRVLVRLCVFVTWLFRLCCPFVRI